ncbi:MAG TPA: serine protease [Nannocystaceae bacterium]|nr:serine protease [Nannocystaceae bacterium]
MRVRIIEGIAWLGIAAAATGCAGRVREVGGIAIQEGKDRPRGGAEAQLARSSTAIGSVETDSGRGMGCVIAQRGSLITNRHVIEDADHIESVRFPQQNPPKVYESISVVYTDPDEDLALLRIHTDDELPFVPLATRKLLPVGRYVHESDPVVLFRRGDDVTDPLRAEYGEVARLAVYNPAAGPGAFVGVSPAVARGQSGGPVLDRQGRVLGVVTWTWRDRDGGFAIPIAEATRMLAERPDLASQSDKVERAETRSRRFLTALGKGDVDSARRLTSPSFARKLRGESVAAIMGAAEQDGMPVLQGFVAAIESVASDPGIETEAAYGRLREIVERTGTDTFRTALGLHEGVARGQVISFFYEFGQAYFAARQYGKEQPPAALDAALRRLQTVDAARTFALADAVDALSGTAVEITRVEVVPGAYAPRAIVHLRGVKPGSTPAVGKGGKVKLDTLAGEDESIAVHMRLEWGDWYVASVGREALSNPAG